MRVNVIGTMKTTMPAMTTMRIGRVGGGGDDDDDDATRTSRWTRIEESDAFPEPRRARDQGLAAAVGDRH